MPLKFDKTFAIIVAILLTIGIVAFLSASLGLLVRVGFNIERIYVTQIGIGLVGGLITLFATLFVPAKWWKVLAPYIYVLGILATATVFIPGLGIAANGATRWVNLHFITFQPSEILKIGAVFGMAFIFANYRWPKREKFGGLLRLVAVSALPLLVLVLQPDIGTTIVMMLAIGTVYIAAGAPWRDVLIIALVALIAAGALLAIKPYLLDRVKTFMNPAADPTGSGYQIKQSWIAIGSGELFGRGIGKSVQKFNYLPEPIGDSVFAVYAEEVGFVGSVLLLVLFSFLFMRGFKIASRANNRFSALLVVGLVSLVVYQSLLNIASIIGLMPLTGLPMAFMSHGGTSLLVTLFMVGIILNISENRRV